ncbi:hypothetical protein I3760_11G199000 [Carya illinoinensis]|uniref:Cellulose synthase-like protein E6 n=1 Tax=Carya illinoinensis TaxID=32201 RepID=A0A922DSL9_CARIL|nr:hypothetical protein I3760_11G199000 [Carya illinoinensis]KAG6690004.1 hypothetical protein I3842_11G201800 [Carya illinoinensis]
MVHMDKGGTEEDEALALFETKEARFRGAYRLFASTIVVGICLIWVYRLSHLPRSAHDQGRWAWIGLFLADVCFSLYWIFTQSARCNVVYRYPFKDRLSHRYEEKLPGVDILVCTADPKMEPPTMVINTVLSAMSYNYPPEKLSVYLSDDGGSELTFYALLEASAFSKHWIPFCKKFRVEPMSPAAYFSKHSAASNSQHDLSINIGPEWLAVKKLYEEMKNRIDSIVETGMIPKKIRDQHKGFSEWNSNATKQDHQSIVQIMIDGRDKNAVDIDGGRLPMVVYMAREKRPQWPHNFKAGALNALLRVSAKISNAPFILNLDCDMYANDADAVREALCFFMDEGKGKEIAFVQHPQNYDNITKNDIYSTSSSVANKFELPGIGGYEAALYCGTVCFHRRESLCGKVCSKDYRGEWNSTEGEKKSDKTVNELEEASKVLANCSHEKDTQWGKKMGLIYGCPVEDIVTGLTIQCRGWKSLYYNPDKKAFLGVAPATLDTALIQQKRWSEGMFQIFFSKYCPFIYGRGKIKLGAQMGYCMYLLWAPISLPALYYVIVPPLCLLRGIPLFPQVYLSLPFYSYARDICILCLKCMSKKQVKSLWFLPFAYVFLARNTCSIAEALCSGDTLKAWWNSQRIWVIRRTTSYFFAFIDTMTGTLGLSQTTFALTDKVMTEDVSKRYAQEIIEFGSSSVMFTVMATLAMLNLFSLIGCIAKAIMDLEYFKSLDQLIVQIILVVLLVMLNIPVYQALFTRRDKGRIPSSVLFNSILLASLACLVPII